MRISVLFLMFVMGLAVTESLRIPPVTKEANRRTWNLIQKFESLNKPTRSVISKGPIIIDFGKERLRTTTQTNSPLLAVKATDKTKDKLIPVSSNKLPTIKRPAPKRPNGLLPPPPPPQPSKPKKPSTTKSSKKIKVNAPPPPPPPPLPKINTNDDESVPNKPFDGFLPPPPPPPLPKGPNDDADEIITQGPRVARMAYAKKGKDCKYGCKPAPRMSAGDGEEAEEEMPKKSTRKRGSRRKSMTKKPMRRGNKMMISDDEEEVQPKPKPMRKTNKVNWDDEKETGAQENKKPMGKGKKTTEAVDEDEETEAQPMKKPTRKSGYRMKKPTRKRDSRGRFATS